MSKTNRRAIVTGLFGLTLLATSLSFAGQQAVSDSVAQAIWGGGCACTGTSTCPATECGAACTSFSGGSYPVCASSASGTCTADEAQCGTRNYCGNGEGDCTFGGTDCTCHSANVMVTGC